MSDDPQVTENADEHRFEIRTGGELAGFTVYEDRGASTRVFVHTEINGHEGEGLGSTLVQFALDDAREHDLRVVPRCPFVKHFIDTHPEYADLTTG